MTEILKVRHMGEILKSLQGGTFYYVGCPHLSCTHCHAMYMFYLKMRNLIASEGSVGIFDPCLLYICCIMGI